MAAKPIAEYAKAQNAANLGNQTDVLRLAARLEKCAANAYLGVGDSNAAESASQTGLQAATNKLYKAMETGYPQRSGQTVTFRAVFTDGEANWAWEEFSVSNSSGGDTGDNLNRKVSSEGTKVSGTWTLDLEITFS